MSLLVMILMVSGLTVLQWNPVAYNPQLSKKFPGSQSVVPDEIYLGTYVQAEFNSQVHVLYLVAGNTIMFVVHI